MWRLRVIPSLLLIFVMAASCPSGSDKFNANSVDTARSARLASDPWLVPSEVKHGGFRGVNLVDRERITREQATPSDGDPARAVLAELEKAVESGWAITFVRCGMAVPGAFTWTPSADDESLVAEADLEKSPTDLDHAAFAKLVAYISTTQDDGAPFKLLTRISAYPAYHSDKGWPNLPSVPVRSICLIDKKAGAIGQKSAPGFPDGVVEGLARSQPLNERGEPDRGA